MTFINKYIIAFFLMTSFVSAQDCFEPDASIWLGNWHSCKTSPNPKDSYGSTHWLRYDLGEIRTLSKSWVWNFNDPDNLDIGFNLVKIDHSVDGVNWTYWGEMNFPKAEGKAIYSGFSGPDLTNIKARFILLSPMSNYGNPSCFGISEIKFNLLPGFEESIISSLDNTESNVSNYTVYPNPASSEIIIGGEIGLSKTYRIVNGFGQVVQDGIITRNSNFINVAALESGIYFIKLDQSVLKLIKS